MKAHELGAALGLEAVQKSGEEKVVVTGYTSDLLSDVMANADENSVLITIQAHVNTIAVAALTGVSAVILCNSRPVPDDMTDAAAEESIPLYRSEENQFTVSHKVHECLNRKD
ncbi:MAG: DRTGG domain-containing protein [Chitinispirillaceae bacterium]